MSINEAYKVISVMHILLDSWAARLKDAKALSAKRVSGSRDLQAKELAPPRQTGTGKEGQTSFLRNIRQG